MFKALVFALATAAFLVAYPATAHPGNTAADGCHYCRTNCDKWGEVWDERHCHGGGSAPAPVAPKPATPKPTPKPTPAATPKPTVAAVVTSKPATPVPTLAPTPAPTGEVLGVRDVATPAPTATVEATIEPATTPVVPVVPVTEEGEGSGVGAAATLAIVSGGAYALYRRFKKAH